MSSNHISHPNPVRVQSYETHKQKSAWPTNNFDTSCKSFKISLNSFSRASGTSESYERKVPLKHVFYIGV